MTILSSLVFDPGAFAAWLLAGVLCGFLANKVMEVASYGIQGDVLLGALGAFSGGLLFSFLTSGPPSFWGSVLVALIGAVVFIGGGRAIAAARAE